MAVWQAFNLVWTVIDVNDMWVAVVKGLRDGDWNDAFRTAERLDASRLAAFVIVFAFAALAATLMGASVMIGNKKK